MLLPNSGRLFTLNPLLRNVQYNCDLTGPLAAQRGDVPVHRSRTVGESTEAIFEKSHQAGAEFGEHLGTSHPVETRGVGSCCLGLLWQNVDERTETNPKL